MVLLVIGAVMGGYAVIVNYAVTGLRIRMDRQHQTVEGFGASSAWTYQYLGLIEDEEVKEEAIEKLYGESGLALNTFRYNIGAGSSEVSDFIDPMRATESYFVAEKFDGDYTAFSNPSNYDFNTRDKGVRELFEKALSKGQIKRIVFYVNSPHYLMTVNGDTNASKAYENNLKPECYEAFSDYVYIIACNLYRKIVCKYDPTIKIYLSPVYEPQGEWGGRDVSQEGCHYDPEVLAEFYDVFYNRLKQRNLQEGTDFVMDIFESSTYKLTASGAYFQRYMKAMSKYEYFDSIERIVAHAYEVDTNDRARNLLYSFLKRSYNGMDFCVSEYCVQQSGVDPSIDMGIYSAKVVMKDLVTLNAVTWNYWLSVSTYDYENGLVYWDTKDNNLFVTKRYYALGQFSKYIETGSVRLGTEYMDTLGWNGVEIAAFLKTDGRIAVVIINDSSRAKKIKIDGSYGNVIKTTTDADNDWLTSEFEYGGSLSVSANSITTFVLTPSED